MKIAEALSLRKALNTTVARLSIAETCLAFPVTKTYEKNIGQMDSPAALLEETKTYQKPVMTIVGELYHYSRCLSALDDLIQQANCSLSVSLPTSVDTFYSGAHVGTMRSVTVNDALLLGKHAKFMVDAMTTVISRAIKEPKISRAGLPGANPNALDKVSVVVNTFDLAEAHKAKAYWEKSLRTIDTAIQQSNWLNEIDVQQWVTEAYDPAKLVAVQAVAATIKSVADTGFTPPPLQPL